MRLRCAFEIMELDGQKIAVPIGENSSIYQGVIKLNDTASFIFDLLQSDVSEDSIVDAMIKEFNASREELMADVHECIIAFKEKGLLSE